MSFVDLATLTLHRRHELESRIHVFDEKCERAINDIKSLKMKANGFVSEINCDPSELKERFLHVMQKLDEYMYLITDFNLAMAQTADTGSTEYTPVQDNSTLSLPPSLSPFNLMDALTEPRPAMPHACPNLCTPDEPDRPKTTKDEQRLIVFSSSSSAESVSRKSEKEIQCQITVDIPTLAIEEAGHDAAVAPSSPVAKLYKECCITAAQSVLEVDHEYRATIVCVDAGSFWVITEDTVEVTSFMREMTDYYVNNKRRIEPAELVDMTYCAYKDENVYYRAMFLEKPQGETTTVSLYVVDTGEIRKAPMESLRPLEKRFCERPPFARFCHLAGVDLVENENDMELMKKQDAFLKEYEGVQCTILVDDNSSESLGVYVNLPSKNTTLNELMVEHNLAVPIDKPLEASMSEEVIQEPPTDFSKPPPKIPNHGPPPEDSEEEWNIDIAQCPEYEDPVLAVTGYHNRDEADICKHYKGGPEKTCFKGSRCPKKHILHHPDGWTLDQVEVMQCKSAPLPAPGTWLKVVVTAVCHFDRVYVQIIEDTQEEEIPEFGLVLPPMTLESLRRDMNSPATIQAYKPLTLAPAEGEMVAALYPMDKRWYRARVLTVTRADQSVELMYVDYGTVLWVKEDSVRALEPRFTALPMQGVLCALAGVMQRGDSTHWARAKRALADLVQDSQVDAHVIAREFDELIVELISYDDPDDPTSGQSVGERLALRGLVDLREFSVADDDDVTHKLVVP